MSKNTEIKKVGLISANNAFGEFGRNDSTSLARKYGIQIVADERFGPQDADMTAQLTRIAKAGAQAVVCWTIGPTAPIVAKNMKQLGMTIPLYLCHGNTFPEHIKIAGDAAEGNIFAAIKPPVYTELPNSDPAKAMLTELITRYEKVAGKPLSVHGWHAWDCLKLAEEALKNAKPNPANLAESRAKIRDGIEGVKNLLLTNGVFNMSPMDHSGTRAPTSLVMITVKNGKFAFLAP
jgi:branched-chain amino acid transport system substrate-binding protein